MNRHGNRSSNDTPTGISSKLLSMLEMFAKLLQAVIVRQLRLAPEELYSTECHCSDQIGTHSYSLTFVIIHVLHSRDT